MIRKFESHNLFDRIIPREYEACWVNDDGTLLVKTVVYQDRQKVHGGKPIYRWRGMAFAWTPGASQDGDYTHLCRLSPHELTVREVKETEATEDTWLEACRLDAECLIERATVYAGVLESMTARATGKRRGKMAA
jgi:hypothetical protein